MEEKQSTMYWVVGIIVLVIIVVGIAYSVRNTDDATDDTSTVETSEMTMEEKMQNEEAAGKDDGFRVLAKADADDFKDKSLNYMYEGSLTDVAGGTASGVARSNFTDGIYELYADFENLPEPAEGEFYEGWIVRMEPFEFISTGKVEMVDGMYRNTYQSSTDLTPYDFYVLTIEPDDGDPLPADHILEGTMTEKN